MLSKDTLELERLLTQKLKKSKEMREIIKTIKLYLNSKKISKSLNIIYKLIRDNYCHIFQNILLDITTNLKNNIKIELDAKLDNIIF